MSNVRNIVGHKYNHLLVIEFAYSKNHKSYWSCLCDCGNRLVVRSNSLRTNHVKSCGCMKSDGIRKSRFKHGMSYKSEYTIWLKMKSRCTNTADKAYKNYGGRGIAVCNEWLDFNKFISDIGRRPSDKYSLERLDNEGDYEASNCKWATRSEQSLNKRTTLLVDDHGITLPLLTYCKQIGLNYICLRARHAKARIKTGLSLIPSSLLVCTLLLMSCSPSAKLRKAKRLIKEAELSGLTWSSDTVFKNIEVFVPASSADTIVKVVNWTDTLTMVRDRITTKVLVRPETKTVYISSKCDSVVITRRVPYEVNREIRVGDSFWKNLNQGFLWFIVGFGACWLLKLFKVIP